MLAIHIWWIMANFAAKHTTMSQQYAKGHALLERYKTIYQQNRFGCAYKIAHPNATLIKTTADEQEYAFEIVEILNGKYGEDCCVPTEDYMAELLEKAAASKRKVGYVQRQSQRVDAATGMVITDSRIDGCGYIGIL